MILTKVGVFAWARDYGCRFLHTPDGVWSGMSVCLSGCLHACVSVDIYIYIYISLCVSICRSYGYNREPMNFL